MKIRPAIVIIENNKLMLMRYSYSGKDVYQFPGGNTEEIETLEQTLAREMEEELNLSVSVGPLLISAQVINQKKQQATLHCLFKGFILNSAKPVINPKETSALEVVWMETSRLSELNLYPSVGKQVQQMINTDLSQNNYLGVIEQPWF